ncbi:uncharacterized protein LOC130791871 [Actinidia eriantha]|uniref:uncharacterized protein LOC130791871 n=1 Tax=Actinidia eriantha TaxID=165200 RepID=UPI0025912B74|nr:uncharacterized protein LOC130791871 [Actinidia eriantha]
MGKPPPPVNRLDRSILSEGPLVQEEQALSLTHPVLDKEIKDTIFDIGDEKALGPGGFSSCFFKKAWNIVSPDVCAPIKEFFRFGKLLKQISHVVIVLVPKSPNASKFEEFRPIAYCNVELLQNYGWSRISLRCIIKIDIRKAYDTVNWDFLDDVLTGLGCLTLFMEWVMQNLRWLKMSPDFNFHPKCSALNITHLAFADDLILFSRGDVPSVRLSLDCLKQFGDSFGLWINDNKLNVFMGGINRVDMEEIKAITCFNFIKFPFRYLGIPMATSRLTIEQFNPLIAKISEYISTWAGASLLYAGRSELIRSMLQGVECFWLSILHILVGVRDKIISLCRNFLCGGKTTTTKKPLVAWKEICRPKSEGGLGFIDLNAWNLALVSKSL